MSLLKGFNAQGGRPAAQPSADHGHAIGDQPNWAPQSKVPQTGGHGAVHGGAAQGQPQHWGQQPAPSNAGYGSPAHGYGAGYPGAQQAYGQPGGNFAGLSANPDPYAPSFEPYAAPAPQPAPRAAPAGYPSGYPTHAATAPNQPAQNYGQQAHAAPQAHPAQQWTPQPAARGFDINSYLPQGQVAQPQQVYRQAEPLGYDAEPAHPTAHPSAAQSDWHAQAAQQPYQSPQGYDYADPNAQYAAQYAPQGDAGYAQQGQEPEGYADDEAHEYEVEETGRGRRPIMMAAALAGAILVGGGLAYGYKSMFGAGSNGQPPTVKSAAAPAKTKPADAGGKQFAHTDSKIMGRLGDGAPAAGGAAEVDPNGARKVSTLVVGRDGSIQAPAAAPPEAAPPAALAPAPPAAPVAVAPPAAAQPVAVPGMMVVDALGPKAAAAAAPAAPQKIVVTPPAAAPVPAKPIVVAKAEPATTGSVDAQQAAAAVKKPVAKKVATNDAFTTAAATPAAQPVTSGNGYVAVLASVPLSGTSRMEALKRYADMQQKYGAVLGGKTPDVAEAKLGAKGSYHRLVVGPPASREQANSLCSQLKAQGYTDCWVTSY